MLVLQHICLYCSSANPGRSAAAACQDRNFDMDAPTPITMGPTKKCRTMSESANTAAITLATSASTMGKFPLQLWSKYFHTRGTSTLGEMLNLEISRVTQQLLCSKSHDFLAVFALAHKHTVSLQVFGSFSVFSSK